MRIAPAALVLALLALPATAGASTIEVTASSGDEGAAPDYTDPLADCGPGRDRHMGGPDTRIAGCELGLGDSLVA